MDVSQLKNPYLIGVFMAFMIGPVFFMLLKTSILKGARAALVFDLGVILGDVTFILMAYYGSKSLLEKIKDDPRLFLVGGLILIVYGFITFLDKNNKKELEQTEVVIPKGNNYFKLLLNGFFLNFINIGVLAGWLGIMVMVGPSLDMNENAIFWFFVKVILAYFIADIFKIILAKQLKKKMTPIVIYRIKRGMGILLILFGSIMMLKSLISKKQMEQLIDKVEISNPK